MKNKPTPLVVPIPAENKWKKPISQLVCSVIMYFALAVIVLLAVPMCLLLGTIGGVWYVTDKMIRAIELAAK